MIDRSTKWFFQRTLSASQPKIYLFGVSEHEEGGRDCRHQSKQCGRWTERPKALEFGMGVAFIIVIIIKNKILASDQSFSFRIRLFYRATTK
jgi:hypothetical protein